MVSFAGNMKELDELYADFKKVDDELLKIKRAKKAQEMSRYRNKKKLKKKLIYLVNKNYNVKILNTTNIIN